MRRTLESPLGPLRLTAECGALTALDWGRAPAEDADPHLAALLDEAARQIAAYFEGRLTRFDLPLAPTGTAFRRRVWSLMEAIPHGRTVTYGDLAREAGSAPRAIGGACGANPLPILIPCHRVLAVNGPGGYSGAGGLTTKRHLLELERRFAMAVAG